MKSFITLVPLCVALLSTASPLGNRALARKHTGVPLARRFILSSHLDAPAACAARHHVPTGENSTITIPDSTTTDNSTLPEPITAENTTVVDNSIVADAPVDANDTAPADNSTDADAVAKRYNAYEFHDFGDAWFDLCMNSGGDIFHDSDPCFTYGINGFSALLADADVCAQQENAEAMITFAKSRGVLNSVELIQVATAYRRLPRESVQIFGLYPSTPYCGRASIHPELRGIWNEQLEFVTIGLFGGPNYPIVRFGEEGSCPYGLSPDVTSCSCVSTFYSSKSAGNITDTSRTNSTTTEEDPTTDDAEPTDTAEPTDAAEPTDDAEPTASDVPVETGSDAAASSTRVAPVAEPTFSGGLSGDVNDPNGR
ncbi:hypothetical protein C8R43DRAFT_1119403 [Mycena crocata]|nr:hypothetical protein C8R43DRAFT_1119403 [Mycena crocata]